MKVAVDQSHVAEGLPAGIAVDIGVHADSSPDRPTAQSGRLYYGWIMLPVAMAGFIATAPGQTFGVSIFNEPIRESLGLSHGELAAAYTLGTLCAALPLAYIGGLIDRHGLRRSMTATIVLFGLACLAAAAAGGWFMLFGAFCLLRMLGPGALALTSSNTLANWFHRRLGMAEGFRQVGMAMSMAVVPAVNLWLLNHFGWRGSYVVFAFAVWAGLLPLMLFVYRERPEDVGQSMDGASPSGDAARSKAAAYNEPLRTQCSRFRWGTRSLPTGRRWRDGRRWGGV